MYLYLLCWSIERIEPEQTCHVDLQCGWSWYTATIPILEYGQFSGLPLTHESLFYFDLVTFYDRKQKMIRILCLRSYPTLCIQGIKVYWFLEILFTHSLGIHYQPYAYTILYLDGCWRFLVAGWHFAISCYTGWLLFSALQDFICVYIVGKFHPLCSCEMKRLEEKYCTIEWKRKNDWHLEYLLCQLGIHSLDKLN